MSALSLEKVQSDYEGKRELVISDEKVYFLFALPIPPSKDDEPIIDKFIDALRWQGREVRRLVTIDDNYRYLISISEEEWRWIKYIPSVRSISE